MADELTAWPDALQHVLDAASGPLKRVTVLRETDSTQDAARRIGAAAGSVIIAARQTRGRGRLGSAWADTADEGIAATFILPRESGERLAFVSAVATARAAETFLVDVAEVGIKWPNDIVADGKKLAGVLIEQDDEFAFVGIGMNISQMMWPDELADRAVSLAQLGAMVSRLDALCALLRQVNDVVSWPDAEIAEAYHACHVLRDRTVQFSDGGEACVGKVVGLCIERGLNIETENGPRWLSAAVTRVVNSHEGAEFDEEES